MSPPPDVAARSPRPTRDLGALTVPAIGYGAMELGGAYNPATDDATALAALSAAIDAGCALVDTSDAYGPNELQIAAFLASGRRRDEIVISTKFGMRPFPDAPRHRFPVAYGTGEFVINAEARFVRPYLERSLERLGTDHVDLYQPHFTDPEVAIEDTVAAMVPLRDEGLVRHLALSNPTVDDLRRAQTVAPIAAVQVDWSMWWPIDAELLAHCEATGVGIVAYSPIGRGFLTGTVTAVGPSDFRASIERFTPRHLAENLDRFAPLRALAADAGVTPGQLALAWLLHRSPVVVPIPGSRTPAHIRENAAAGTITLTAEQWTRVDAAVEAFVPVGRVG
ncbi:MAG: aldo/keto reductase [Actinobacteria bacterium]|nr:aldo/keto reductase [Actinomycetota bacterium]